MKSKWCWLVRQYHKGWRLGLCIGDDTPMYINFWFGSTRDIRKVVGKRTIVFVYLSERTSERRSGTKGQGEVGGK